VIRKLAWAACVALAACATTTNDSQPPAPVGRADYADFLVGRVANLNADYAAAAERYQAALIRAPHDQDLLDGAVSAALAAGDIERGRRIVRSAPEDTTSPYARLLRGADDLSARHFRDAARELAAVRGGGAQEFAAAILGMWAKAGQGQADVIDDDLRPLLTVRPFGSLLNAQQAMAYDLAGRNAEALQAYASAAEGGLWLPQAIVRHADLLARTGAGEQAGAVLSDSANAGNPEIVAAAAHLAAGQSPAAAALTPARAAAIGLYGVSAIYFQQSDSANGLIALTLAQMLDPTLDAARIAAATQQARLGHADRAIETLQAIPAASAYASSARVMEAWTLVDEGRGDDAVTLAQQAAASGDVRATRALGDIYRQLGRYDAAEGVYSTLITAHPDDWRLYFARGAVLMRTDRVADGEADLQRALALSPDQPDVLNYLGYAWIDQGVRLQEALGMIQRAVALRPDSAAIVDSLGWAYYRMGDYPRALDALERAVQIDPGDATLNEHLGDVYWRVGRRTEARFQWNHALAQSPDDADAIRAKLAHGLPAAAVNHPARR
jgi:tetratricopeptide (TPR) repeat protein